MRQKETKSEKPSGRLGCAVMGGIAGIAIAYAGICAGGAVYQNTRWQTADYQQDGNTIKYEFKAPACGFLSGPFLLIDKNGQGITTISSEGKLVTKIYDNDNDGILGEDDVLELNEKADGIEGIVKYESKKVTDSNGTTTYEDPKTVWQFRIQEYGRQQRAKWDDYYQKVLPALKAKLH